VRHGKAAGLLAGWLVSVATVAGATWAVLGVALGQIVPAAVTSSPTVGTSSRPSGRARPDPDPLAGPDRTVEGSPLMGGSGAGSGRPGPGKGPVAGRGPIQLGPATWADAVGPGPLWVAPVSGPAGEAPVLPPMTGTPGPSAPGPSAPRPSGARPAGSDSGAVPATPFGPAPLALSDPPAAGAGGGDLTPERVSHELRTGSLLRPQGQVLITCSEAGLVDWSVLPAAGWSAAVTGEGPTGIQVQFTQPRTVLVVIAECDRGSPRFRHGKAKSSGGPTSSVTGGPSPVGRSSSPSPAAPEVTTAKDGRPKDGPGDGRPGEPRRTSSPGNGSTTATVEPKVSDAGSTLVSPELTRIDSTANLSLAYSTVPASPSGDGADP
jgi:hypothetical protein